MKCPRCGNEIPEGSKFCTVCGLPQKDRGQQSAREEDRRGQAAGGNPKPPIRQRTPQEEAARKRHNRNLLILIVVILAAAAAAAFFVIRLLRDQGKGSDRGSLSVSQLEDWADLPEDAWIPELEDLDEGSDSDKEEPSDSEEESARPTAAPTRKATPTPTPKPTHTATPTPTPVPTYDPEEGGVHRYEYVVKDCTWREAFQEAKNSGGYLVRINSRAEYDAILSEINSKGLTNIHFRIGGRRDADSRDYYWVDENNQLYGEKINDPSYWCSSEWMTGEPSFQDGSTQEDCLDICYLKSEGKWYFNDVPDDILATVSYYSGRLGYIIEYED